jgi:hypothetical protein
MSEELGSGSVNPRDILVEIWRKIESIETKLDTRFYEIEKRVIILELSTLKKEGPTQQAIHEIDSRVTSLETINAGESKASKVLSDKRKESFTVREIVISIIALGAVFTQILLNAVGVI